MEVFDLQTRCEQLTGTIKALESQLQQQLTLTSQEPTDRGVGMRREGEEELFQHKFQGLGEILAHNRETQDQLLKCQKENMRLRFEYEQAVVELSRLQVGGWSMSHDVSGVSLFIALEMLDDGKLITCIFIPCRPKLRISWST